MKSILALFAVLALLLIANTSHARPVSGEYWHVMNDEAMPMIQDLVDIRNSADFVLSERKGDTKVTEEIVYEKLTVNESDPIPDTTMAW
ncbi:hypothetical protein DCAR_0626517 [Daucus carota subsp. sativus]|uniref:Cysteine proteinase inhibitor n=1 Tax=Daucus carota subsp. sativus TaxID=79200 RepID=A0AAF1B744_DAUCS|nr:PREDICTED: uncharacterized protein LOC108226657 [Daucus carota subsp. sativus]WOH07088.1 hypothetical protein DCAR_0626517 [Daucus carota subsp. sativus]